jgi:hypothetical protein
MVSLRCKLIARMVIVTFLFCSITCKKSDILLVDSYSQPTDVREIIPLQVGYQWTYRCTWWAIDTGGIYTSYLRIQDTSEWGYLAHGSFFESLDTNTTWFFATDSTSFKINYGSPELGMWAILLKAPIQIGTRWFTDSWQLDRFSTIKNIDTSIIINQTRYNHTIYIVDSITGGFYGERFIVPSVGVVYETDGGSSLELLARNFK